MRQLRQIVTVLKPGRALVRLLACLIVSSILPCGWVTSAFAGTELPSSTHGSRSLEAVLAAEGWDKMIKTGELRKVTTPRASQSTTHNYSQFYSGIPVIGGRLVIRTDKNDEVSLVQSSLAKWRKTSQPDFRITSDNAVVIARKISLPQEFTTDPKVTPIVLPVNGEPVFCYRVTVSLSKPVQAMDYYINGANGTLRLAEDHLKHFDGRGLVFDPDPKSVLQDENLTDNDDDSAAVPIEAYSEVSLPEISCDEDSLLVLTGPFADTNPTANRIRSETGEFLFDRGDDNFEEVMAYFHIDRQARYLEALGVEGLTPQLLDINRLNDDASYYNPQTGVITTGRGGVDDAEDADVLLHEFTHAIIEAYLPDWRGGETGILAEGLCDYFAGDYSLSVSPDFEPMNLYNWDGHNQFWAGRVLNSDYHYPEDCEDDIHDAGQLWSSLLTEVRLAGDRDLWNQIVLDHLISLSDSTTIPDAVSALLVSDVSLTGGVFRQAIIEAAERRGVISNGQYAPIISHTTPRDTENENAPITVTVGIQPDPLIALDNDNIWLIYNFEESEPESLLLRKSDGANDAYQAEIPAPNRPTVVSYYFFAADEAGVFSVDPPNAPEEKHRFIVGPDHIRPVIVEQDRLPDTVFPVGEARFGVKVSDNIGISEVRLIWYDEVFDLLGQSVLEPQGEIAGLFIGPIHWEVERDQSILYRLRVTDAAANNPNVTLTVIRNFTIRSDAIIDDFEYDNQNWSLNDWQRTDSESYAGAYSMADRSPDEISTPHESIAEFSESWDFAGMGHARLKFVERHIFDQAFAEHGVIEILEEGAEAWREIYRVSGQQQNWIEREVNLDRWAMRNSPTLRLRFRTITPDGARQLTGWLIDDLRLRVGNIVAVDDKAVSDKIQLGLPYPNPTNGFINVRVESNLPIELFVYDLFGRKVLTAEIPAGNAITSIDFKPLPTGIYWIKPKNAGNIKKQIVLLK